MRLQEIEIENFRIIRSARVSFPDALVGIIGPNGSGKSSLIEAISWALYGNQVSRTARDEIRSSFALPGESCTVRLRFSLRNDVFQITRQLSGRSANAQVEVLRNGEPESTGTVETRDYMRGLLGLDWRGFLTSFLARQQELNALSDLQPAKRRDQLAGMLGIERLDKALTRLKDDLRFGVERLSIHQQQVVSANSLTEELAQAREHERQATAGLAVSAGAWTSIDATFREHEAQLREHEARKTRVQELNHRLHGAKHTQAAVLQQFRDQQETLEGLRGAESEQRDLEPILSGAGEVIERLSQLSAAKAKLELKVRLERDRGGLAEQLSDSRTRTEALSTQRAQLEPVGDPAAQDITVRILNTRQQESQLNAELGRLTGERAAAVQDAAKVSRQIAEIRELGPEARCDRCLRPFGHDYGSIQQHLDEELVKAERLVESLAAQIKLAENQHQEIMKSLRSMELQESQEKEARNKHGLVESQFQAESARTAQLEHQLGTIETELEQLGEFDYDPEEYRALSEAHGNILAAKEKHVRLSGLLESRPNILRTLEQFEAQLDELRRQEVAIEAELKGVGFDEDALREAAARFQETSELREIKRTEKTRAELDVELVRQRIEMLSKQEAEMNTARTAVATLQDEQLYSEKLARLLSGFRQELIQRIRPRLSELTSQLMQDMTAGKYPLVELDEDYNLRMYDSEQYYGIERFSGGEKDLANLALRLAISLALTESAGFDRSCIILDEVLASQDESRRESILAGLVHLKQRFPQILLITHINEIKDRVETAIEVIPTDRGWSEVRVVGA